jgi:hypothetical protein
VIVPDPNVEVMPVLVLPQDAGLPLESAPEEADTEISKATPTPPNALRLLIVRSPCSWISGICNTPFDLAKTTETDSSEAYPFGMRWSWPINGTPKTVEH